MFDTCYVLKAFVFRGKLVFVALADFCIYIIKGK